MRIGLLFIVGLLLLSSCDDNKKYVIKYVVPAQSWADAVPMGNDHLIALIYGDTDKEHIRFLDMSVLNQDHYVRDHLGNAEILQKARNLIDSNRVEELSNMLFDHFNFDSIGSENFLAFGDLVIDFPGDNSSDDYYREIDFNHGIYRVNYSIDQNFYRREYFISEKHRVMAIHLDTDKKGSLGFHLDFDTNHGEKNIESSNDQIGINLIFHQDSIEGFAKVMIHTDGTLMKIGENSYSIEEASTADIFMTALTSRDNIRSFEVIDSLFTSLDDLFYPSIKREHIKYIDNVSGRNGPEK